MQVCNARWLQPARGAGKADGVRQDGGRHSQARQLEVPVVRLERHKKVRKIKFVEKKSQS